MARAEKLRDELLDFAWDHRSDFIYEIEPLETSLERAAEMGRQADGGAGPVVLLDNVRRPIYPLDQFNHPRSTHEG